MSSTAVNRVPLRQPDRFFIGGRWLPPSTEIKIDVVDPATEGIYFQVPEAKEADMDRAVTAARRAFDEGPWPCLGHRERAKYLRAIGTALQDRLGDAAQIWHRESGVAYSAAQSDLAAVPKAYLFYAGLAETLLSQQPLQRGDEMGSGLLIRKPVGVVGAIISPNRPMLLIPYKIAPALLAGCTLVLRASPEAPGAAYLIAEIAESVNLPPGVLNVVAADREVSESMVRDLRVDKILFTSFSIPSVFTQDVDHTGDVEGQLRSGAARKKRLMPPVVSRDEVADPLWGTYMPSVEPQEMSAPPHHEPAGTAAGNPVLRSITAPEHRAAGALVLFQRPVPAGGRQHGAHPDQRGLPGLSSPPPPRRPDDYEAECRRATLP
ncbi:aldehyde dehydrogenase family protein [Pseudonocardia xinjiangensis]|uniref:aldehyde dehydrogenase family protein n=1 Tax=Pseudonocardia xinjiangensis TaxID=75289 RepID=UPI003D8F81C1